MTWNCLGNFCCDSCIEILGEDLPDMQISNFTAGEWTGGPCCWTREYLPIDDEENTTCSADILTKTHTATTTYDEYFKTNPPPPVIPVGIQPCPIPQEKCCDHLPGYSYLESGELSFERIEAFRLLTHTRINKIVVKISKQNVDCGVDGVGLRWVIEASYCYIVTNALQRTKFEGTHTTTNTGGTHPCLVRRVPTGTPGEILPVCTFNLSGFGFSEFEDYSIDPPECDLSSDQIISSTTESICFTRLKLYEVLPEDEIVFDSTDTPDCTFPHACHATEYITEYCFELDPLTPELVFDCCDFVEWNVATSTITTPQSSKCGTATCQTPGNPCGTSYVYYYSPPACPPDLDDALGLHCCVGCSYDPCPSLTDTLYTFTYTHPRNDNDPEGELPCPPLFSENCYFPGITVGFEIEEVGRGFTMLGKNSGKVCWTNAPCPPASSTCHYLNCADEPICTAPIYGSGYIVTTSMTWDITIDFTPISTCLYPLSLWTFTV